ncbi:hypothetical protein SAMN02799624_01658 [Paenibacillus sp. UNC496MF]|uniref:hypothetical protein n=1 Tax=Paenibacillus sp. UNC496MF TaxID=1502753 RepID=UPI0008E349AD|nr:hypothetical protein [Paenibacillus sp. UNC496MF]SFI61710.1 hypothetical protein SAMN02799624_01658 [Paenibacillus sp. UNC496MF]
MEEQQAKRPIFTPIVLIVLTVSLIGNVFLYSKLIQNDQTSKADRGAAVIRSGNGAKAFFDEAAADTGDLLAKGDIADRMLAKSKLLAAYRQASAAADFIRAAEDANGRKFAAKRGADEFLDQTLASLQAVGNHAGPLTAGEQAYLNGLLQAFKACQQELSAFQHDTVNKEQSLAILVDAGWPSIAGSLLTEMNKPADLAFKG